MILLPLRLPLKVPRRHRHAVTTVAVVAVLPALVVVVVVVVAVIAEEIPVPIIGGGEVKVVLTIDLVVFVVPVIVFPSYLIWQPPPPLTLPIRAAATARAIRTTLLLRRRRHVVVTPQLPEL